MALRPEQRNAISTPLTSAHAVGAFAYAFLTFSEGAWWKASGKSQVLQRGNWFGLPRRGEIGVRVAFLFD
jgi:hypothetical protein